MESDSSSNAPSGEKSDGNDCGARENSNKSRNQSNSPDELDSKCFACGASRAAEATEPGDAVCASASKSKPVSLPKCHFGSMRMKST